MSPIAWLRLCNWEYKRSRSVFGSLLNQSLSDIFMRTVAKGLAVGLLTGAKKLFTGFPGFPFHRGKFRSFVAAVAKRLIGRFPTRTPEIGLSRLDFDRDRCGLGNSSFGHGRSPLFKLGMTLPGNTRHEHMLINERYVFDCACRF